MKTFYVSLLFCNAVGALENTPLLSGELQTKQSNSYVSKTEVMALLDTIEPPALQVRGRKLMLPFMRTFNNEYISENMMDQFLQKNLKLTATDQRCKSCIHKVCCDKDYCRAGYNCCFFSGEAYLCFAAKSIITASSSSVLHSLLAGNGGCFLISVLTGTILKNRFNAVTAKEELAIIMKNIKYKPLTDVLRPEVVIARQPQKDDLL
ncbi:hypothetical protein K9K77_01505 [Candidatus Babeliales bacterium]|nr:hypothetical protein [Candidatus Babeliales bacterium]